VRLRLLFAESGGRFELPVRAEKAEANLSYHSVGNLFNQVDLALDIEPRCGNWTCQASASGHRQNSTHPESTQSTLINFCPHDRRTVNDAK
jgi:hypothetical protein